MPRTPPRTTLRTPLRTRLTELFGIRHPILAGGLMWLSDARYTAAFTRAGGLGFLTARSLPDLPSFERELERCAALCDGAPFGVNLTFARSAEARAPTMQMLDAALAFGVRRFETVGAFGLAEIFSRIHAGGGIALHKCSKLRHALSAEAEGADAVVLVGAEAGGHPGLNELPMHVQGAAAARALKIPFALGGGIGTGQQIVAALATGADAVVMGSRFLAADEVWAHEAYKQRVIEAGHDSSTAALHSVGETWRVLANETAAAVRQLEREGAAWPHGYGEQVRGTYGRQHGYVDGNPSRGMLSMGPAIGFVRQREPVAAIFETLLDEIDEALARLDGLRLGLPTGPGTGLGTSAR